MELRRPIAAGGTEGRPPATGAAGSDVRSSLVRVESGAPGGEPDALGMGFFVTPEGHVLTCWHVISDRDGNPLPEIVVEPWGGRRLAASLEPDLSSRADDLAVLKTDHEPGACVLLAEQLRPSADLLFWDLSDPRFLGLPVGGISRARTELADPRRTVFVIEGEIASSLKPGVSGSPIVDAEAGTVAGLVSARAGRRALAIPITAAIESFPRLRCRLAWIARFLEVARADYGEWRDGLFFRDYFDLEVDPDRMFLVPQEQDLLSKRKRFESYSAVQAVAEHESLIILGEPGAGKTTCLREVSRRHLENGACDLLPLYVPLEPLAAPGEDDALGVTPRLLARAFERLDPAWPIERRRILELAKRWPFIFLFDGLNEIPVTDIPGFCKSLRQFTSWLLKENPRAKVVIASRFDNIAEYRGAIKSISKSIFELQRLSSEQRIDRFVHSYMDDPQQATRFLAEVDRQDAMGQMSQNPLLLTMMMLAYEEEGVLPPSRARLLETIVRGLLGEWSQPRPPLYDLEVKHGLLAAYAFELRDRGLGLGTTRAEAEEIFTRALGDLPEPWRHRTAAGDIPAIVEEIKNQRILTQPGERVRFWLEVFQEYLAASYIASGLRRIFDPSRQSRSGDLERGAQRELSRFVGRPDWHQPLAIAAGLVPAATVQALVERLRERRPMLAAMCIGNAAGLPRRVIAQFTESIEDRALRLIRLPQLALWVNVLGGVGLLWLVLQLDFAELLRFLVTPVEALSALVRLPVPVVFLGLATGLAGAMIWGVTSWFRLVDRIESKVVNDLLPSRYLQPLLRSLLFLGTPEAELALSRLRSECRNRRTSETVQSLVERAGLILRFRRGDAKELLRMLESPETREYAMDRLTYLRECRAIQPLLGLIDREDGRLAKTAIWSVRTLAEPCGPKARSDVIETLIRVAGQAAAGSLTKRLAAYDALIALGVTGVRRPTWIDGLLPRAAATVVRSKRAWLFAVLFLILLLGYLLSGGASR